MDSKKKLQIKKRENLKIYVTKMEAQNQKEFEKDNKIEENINNKDEIHEVIDENRQKEVLPIQLEQVHHEQTQVIKLSQDNKSGSQENEEICHRLQEANIDSPLLKKSQQDSSSKVVFQFSSNQPQRGYLESIIQIKNILNDKDLSKVKFIQKILKDFSPYVFTNNQNKNNQKQKEPFDSEVSFDSQGQQKVAKKIQQKNEKQEGFPMVLIDEDFFGTQWLQTIRENETLSNLVKYNAIFHCRIVFVFYVLTSTKYSFEKAYNIQLSQGLQKLKQKLQQNKIRYSFDKNLWTTQRESNLKKYQKNDKQNDKIPFVISQMFRDKLFSKIDEFYTKIGFKNQNHPFNKKMTILKEQTYRLRYIKEFSYYSFSNVEEIFKYLKTQNSQRFNNIEFYSNRLYATSRRLTLSKIHNDKGTDYEWLQRSHDYIQWLFPNHFRSQFNGSSYPLSYIQAEIFKNDPKLRQSLVKSFEIFINFMGCSIKQNVTPIIPQNINEKIKEIKKIIIVSNSDKKSIERLKSCLIYNTHNHLRIMRILACMSVTGLRFYADSLLNFLNGLKRNPNINFQSIKMSLERNWNVYSYTPQNKQKALQMCFIPYTQFSYIEIDEKQDYKKDVKQKMQIQDDHGKKKLKLHINEK